MSYLFNFKSIPWRIAFFGFKKSFSVATSSSGIILAVFILIIMLLESGEASLRPENLWFAYSGASLFIYMFFGFQIGEFLGIDPTPDKKRFQDQGKFLEGSDFSRILPIPVTDWFWGRFKELVLRMGGLFSLTVIISIFTPHYKVYSKDFSQNTIDKLHEMISSTTFSEFGPSELKLGSLRDYFILQNATYCIVMMIIVLSTCWFLRKTRSDFWIGFRISFPQIMAWTLPFSFVILSWLIKSDHWMVDFFLIVYPLRYPILFASLLALILLVRFLSKQAEKGEVF